jgi:cobyrinic acid a,c-diamide synthase
MPDSSLPQRGFYISATKKSSGKTVISLGLGAALTESGLNVQAYKKGPDYIDPMWHQAATGRPCFNLDFFTQTRDEIDYTFDLNRQSADVVYVEGNKGLFDGMDTLGSDCNAALAEQLSLPVVLIVNAQGITRGIAPMLKGYEAFAEGIRYAGVILNEVAGPRHQQKLIKAIETYTDLNILGVVPKLSKLHLEERHLGLVPQNEVGYADAYIKQTASLVKDNVDIERLLAASAELTPAEGFKEVVIHPSTAQALKMGIARDRAFGFYYPDDLQTMQALGVELHFFDTLNDRQLPEVDALFIGGGFPETQAAELQANRLMRAQIKAFIESGKPVYAECGGLMYLCQDISYQGDTSGMVAVIDAQVEMTERPIGRGYAKIQQTSDHIWGRADRQDDLLDEAPKGCHEFHYSRLSGPAVDMNMAYAVARGYGVNGQGDGIMVHNTLAMYCHQRHTRNNPWVEQFVNFIRQHKDKHNENN